MSSPCDETDHSYFQLACLSSDVTQAVLKTSNLNKKTDWLFLVFVGSMMILLNYLGVKAERI